MTITERVEYAIFLVMMPDNMIPSDWFSGAMLGENNGFRKRVQMAAKLAVIEMASAGTKSLIGITKTPNPEIQATGSDGDEKIQLPGNLSIVLNRRNMSPAQ